jgi:hypothetical protein
MTDLRLLLPVKELERSRDELPVVLKDAAVPGVTASLYVVVRPVWRSWLSVMSFLFSTSVAVRVTRVPDRARSAPLRARRGRCG